MEQLEGWLKTQDVRMHQAIAARASMRSLPVAMASADQNFETLSGHDLILVCCRAALIAGVASSCPTSVLKDLKSSANSAANSANSAAFTANSTALSVALSANSAANTARTATLPTYSARTVTLSARSAANSADNSSSNAALNSAMNSAVFSDANTGQSGNHVELFRCALWP